LSIDNLQLTIKTEQVACITNMSTAEDWFSSADASKTNDQDIVVHIFLGYLCTFV